MDLINISHRRFHNGTIHSFSSAENESSGAGNILASQGYWSTKKRTTPINEYVIVDYGDNVPINYIKISASLNGISCLPNGFRIEGSIDGNEWMVLYSEIKTPLDSREYEIYIPLTILRYIKILINDPAVSGSQYFSEIGRLEVGITGLAGIKASSFTSGNDVENIIDGDNNTYWESEHKPSSSREHLFIDMGEICYLSRIVLGSGTEGFPENFHLETSIDNEIWITLFQENGFISEKNKKYFWNTGVTAARYFRFEAFGKQLQNRKFGLRIRELEIFSASLNYDHTHNIGDITPHASISQAGMVRLARDGESVAGTVVQSTDSRLRDATNIFKGIVQLANDGDFKSGLVIQASDKRLQPATEVKNGIVRLAYNGETNPNAVVQSNDSRLQYATEEKYGIVRLAYNGETNPNAVVQSNDLRLQYGTEENFGIVRFCPDGEYKNNSAVSGNDSRIQKATTSSFGITKLAKDGEIDPDGVVQSNDRRLKDATSYSKGIVRIANDGEVAEDAVVQSSDKRLKDATVKSRGIVELAEDGEEKSGVAVQGNDRRLKDASTTAKGIVELAEDGENKPGVAVQGSDRRLKDATTTEKGIVELAEDGENKPGVAVQGSDYRLKDATETSKGIIQFTVDGGSDPLTAVQGNDKRLKDATTMTKGIVELAEDGEDSSGVVVQGNDRRLREATEDFAGIVKLAINGDSSAKVVVQGNDERLYDMREPLPHKHNYADVDHNYNSHSGTISIKEGKDELFKDITPPSDGSSIIYGNNISNKDYSIGLAGISGANSSEKIMSYGVVGHSSHVGVRGQATGNDGSGAGVLGVSRFGLGGLFCSEHGYSLVVDGSGKMVNKYDGNIQMLGNEKGLLVSGQSEFYGRVKINGDSVENEFPGGLVELFTVDEVEYVSPGDILVVNEKGGAMLSKSKGSFNKSVIGIVSGNPYLLINNSGSEEKVYPVVLAGKALCKVDARKNPIHPGDLIVTSETAGCGMSGEIDSFDKIGTVVGKALDRLDGGVDFINVFVMHM